MFILPCIVDERVSANCDNRFVEIEAMLLDSGAQTKADLWVRNPLMTRAWTLRAGSRWTMNESLATKEGIVSVFGDRVEEVKRRRWWLGLREWEVCVLAPGHAPPCFSSFGCSAVLVHCSGKASAVVEPDLRVLCLDARTH